jgi:PAS domain S-box-containing protein
MWLKIKNFISPPVGDPDEIRRNKLINILSLGILISAGLGFIGALTFLLFNPDKWQQPDNQLLILSAALAFLGSAMIYYINKRSSRVASFLLLLMLSMVFTFSDTPLQLSNGRSLFVFTIPIAISSLIIAPPSSFFFAILNSIIITYLALKAETVPNMAAIIGFLFLALISWLSSRNLEQALRELRDINVNLDQIVKERTHALAEALTRERVEAGRSQAILESIADGVIVFDTQGSAIQANPALSNLINMPLNDIVNATINKLVESSPMDAKNKGTLAGLLTEPGLQLSSHRVEWGRKTLSVSSGQVLDRDGSEVGTVAVFRDFTKEAELEKMKSAFVAMVSHELRTPLSAILGYAEIFKERVYGPLNERQLKTTDRIISNSRRLLNLINDLLDQAQMEAGKLKIKYETIKTSSLLENLHSVMDKLTRDKGLVLTSELDENMPETLIGDSARLQQILVNLVNNAVKFTQEGSIHVKISKLKDEQWSIDVKDTGQGIPKDEVPHIFDTFRQVEGTTTRVHGGFGLGLSIVKQLAYLMGGDISVESELGKGSIFSITLPLETESKLKEKA